MIARSIYYFSERIKAKIEEKRLKKGLPDIQQQILIHEIRRSELQQKITSGEQRITDQDNKIKFNIDLLSRQKEKISIGNQQLGTIAQTVSEYEDKIRSIKKAKARLSAGNNSEEVKELLNDLKFEE
jgi:hypothetical protein